MPYVREFVSNYPNRFLFTKQIKKSGIFKDFIELALFPKYRS